MTTDKKEKAYSSQKIQAVEKKILDAVKKAKRAKLNIVTCEWGVSKFEGDWVFPPIKNKLEWVSNSGCACPGGAVLLFNQPSGFDDRSHALAHSLNVDEDFVNGFTCAVDNGVALVDMAILNKMHWQQGFELGCKFHDKIRKSK